MPTAAEPTIHDKVIQAFSRDAELQAEQAELKAKLQAAKQAQDAVRLSPLLADATTRLGTLRSEAMFRAESAQKAAVAKAQKPYNEATTRYNLAVNTALGAYNKVKDDEDARYEAELAVVRKERDVAAADAQATVTQLQGQLAAHQTTIVMHRRNMQDRLGVDTSKVLGG